jgi:TRAP-type mannitol/chloroaromatic compound transport system permease small subunit
MLEITLLNFVIFALGAFRLTHIITTDVIANSFRQWVWSKYDTSTKIGYLITCNWCTGFWVSLLVIAGVSVLPQLTFVVSLVLAISALVGLLSAWAER